MRSVSAKSSSLPAAESNRFKHLRWVCHLLSQWAIWVRTGRVFPQGYPSRTMEEVFRSGRSTKGVGFITPPHPEAEEVERAMRDMPTELRQPMEMHYIKRMPDSEIAHKLGQTDRWVRQMKRCGRYWLHGRLSKTLGKATK